MNLPATFPETLDQAEPATEHRPRHRWGLYGLGAVIVVGLGWAMFHHAPPPPAPPMPTVAVATPLVRPIEQWDDYVGRFAASQTVEVRPRVSGAITAIHFRDGEIVHRGDLLFTIDQRPFAAALAEARANAASARSAVALAQSDYNRANKLTGDDAVAPSEVDSLRAKLQAAQASLAAAEARQRARALDMEFTQVRAPIAGRISDRRIDIGNLVSGGDGVGAGGANGTLLTTINALDPIYFDFDASEALFLKAQRDRAAHTAPAQVEVRLQDESAYRWHGQLSFTDNGLDPRSGTIRIRATFANPAMFLTPGLFGNMRLASSGTVPAMLVPDLAVQTDQARKTVLVAAADGSVSAKPVEVGPVIEGLRVIRSGLAPSDHIIISNLQSAMPGAKVKTTPGRITATPNPNSSPAANTPLAAQATFAR